MPVNVADYGRDFLLKVILGQASMPATLFVAITTGAPDLGWDGTVLDDIEPSDTNYVRQEINNDDSFWTVPDGGFAVNLYPITFGIADADYVGEVTHWVLVTAGTAGEILLFGEFDESKSVLEGQAPSVPIGAMVLELSGPSIGELDE